MIKLKYKALNGTDFLNALRMLANEPVSVSIAMQIKKLGDAVMSARREIGLQYVEKIAKVYAKKNPDGSPVHTAEGGYELDEAQQDAMEKAVTEFGETVFEVKASKLMIEQLGEIKISASVLSALDPVLTELGLVQDEKPVTKAETSAG